MNDVILDLSLNLLSFDWMILLELLDWRYVIVIAHSVDFV